MISTDNANNANAVNIANSANITNTQTSDIYAINDDTLARAILTFCVDGADAIMYTLTIGTVNAASIVDALYSICESITKSTSKISNKQLELDFPTNSHQKDSSENKQQECNTDSSTNDLDNVLTNIVKNHPQIKVLEKCFLEGLKIWGGKSANNKNEVNNFAVLHKSVKKWCLRMQDLPFWDANKLKKWFSSSGSQWIISPKSKYWPKQLQDLATKCKVAPPLCLWGIGDPNALIQCKQPLAIVGSRGCNDYGYELSFTFAKSCAKKGHTIVSGGAYGIDAAAHWGTLDALDCHAINASPVGKTIVVFAGGLNNMGPSSNAQLFNTILASGGACISELCPETIPEARRFLLRNRLIAALASKVIVSQARLRSGALNTANWALELNRELYAVPGDVTLPNNAGCNMLIHDGKAMMICSHRDIEDIYPNSHHYLPHSLSNNESIPDTCNDLQKLILKAIHKCKHNKVCANIDNIHEVIAKSETNGDFSISQISGELAILELDGLIKSKNGVFSINRKKT